jgi:hypothetical protein
VLNEASPSLPLWLNAVATTAIHLTRNPAPRSGTALLLRLWGDWGTRLPPRAALNWGMNWFSFYIAHCLGKEHEIYSAFRKAGLVSKE